MAELKHYDEEGEVIGKCLVLHGITAVAELKLHGLRQPAIGLRVLHGITAVAELKPVSA